MPSYTYSQLDINMIKIRRIMGRDMKGRETVIWSNLFFETENLPNYAPQSTAPLSCEHHKKNPWITILTIECLYTCGLCQP